MVIFKHKVRVNSKILHVSTLLSVILSLIWLFSCNGGEMSKKSKPFPSIKDVHDSAWEKLSKKKIYFGHQSVGNNILAGIWDLMEENPQIKLHIVETNNPSEFTGPVFTHSKVGRNTDPKSKMDAFTTFLEKGFDGKPDINFLKFCYVDITAKTDISAVFQYYNKMISEIRFKYPASTFIHMTVPLTITNTTWKTQIKKLIGKSDIWEYDDNIKRNEFNNRISSAYEGREPVFDLANIESTLPDGKRESFTKDGSIYYSLVPDYTHDGGHLNEMGRKVVAEQLLIFLAKLSE